MAEREREKDFLLTLGSSFSLKTGNTPRVRSLGNACGVDVLLEC